MRRILSAPPYALCDFCIGGGLVAGDEAEKVDLALSGNWSCHDANIRPRKENATVDLTPGATIGIMSSPAAIQRPKPGKRMGPEDEVKKAKANVASMHLGELMEKILPLKRYDTRETVEMLGTVMRNGVEVEVRVTGKRTPFYPATRYDTAEGGDIEDVTADVELTDEEAADFAQQLAENYEPDDYDPREDDYE